MKILIGSFLGGIILFALVAVGLGTVFSRTENPALVQPAVLAETTDIPSNKIHLPVVLHPIRNNGDVSTARTDENILALFAKSQAIWDQADIVFDVSLVEVTLNGKIVQDVRDRAFRSLYTLIDSNDNRLHIFFTKKIGANGIALSPQVALVADVTSVNDFRASAHEIGHLLGLGHTIDSRTRLLYRGVNGTILNQQEIQTARSNAKQIGL